MISEFDCSFCGVHVHEEQFSCSNLDLYRCPSCELNRKKSMSKLNQESKCYECGKKIKYGENWIWHPDRNDRAVHLSCYEKEEKLLSICSVCKRTIEPYDLLASDDDGNDIHDACINFSNDPVNSPSHYNTEGLEVIEIMEMKSTPEEFYGYLKCNVLKYLFREQYKGHRIQDLKKAAWYLNRYIETIEKNEKLS